MLQQQLANLSNFINRYNPYFDTSFTDVIIDDKIGVVNNGSEIVFPNDIYGNYFYIRNASKIKFDYVSDFSIADNYLSLVARASCYLIAYVVDADVDKLVNNLISTIGRYDENTRISEILTHSDDVVIQELAKVLSRPNVASALQDMPENITLISISFTLSFVQPLTELNCLTNPCKTC